MASLGGGRRPKMLAHAHARVQGEKIKETGVVPLRIDARPPFPFNSPPFSFSSMMYRNCIRWFGDDCYPKSTPDLRLAVFTSPRWVSSRLLGSPVPRVIRVGVERDAAEAAWAWGPGENQPASGDSGAVGVLR